MRLEQVTIIVDDYDEAIEFFTGALGFELVEDSPSLTNDGRPKRWVVVRPPGARPRLLLARADGARQAARRRRASSPAGSVSSCASTTSTAPTQRMTRPGSSSSPRPATEPYGRVAVFLDIAGNRWDLLGRR